MYLTEYGTALLREDTSFLKRRQQRAYLPGDLAPNILLNRDSTEEGQRDSQFFGEIDTIRFSALKHPPNLRRHREEPRRLVTITSLLNIDPEPFV
ncbi:hypothetical protein, partial [Frankia sp. Cr1]|uniref:hypothetical protein n=1 Tax=Frankia sp. Cr1 TaxID=3073931 RepID=UPI002AD41412